MTLEASKVLSRMEEVKETILDVMTGVKKDNDEELGGNEEAKKKTNKRRGGKRQARNKEE